MTNQNQTVSFQVNKSYNCPDCHLKGQLFHGNPCDFCGRNTYRPINNNDYTVTKQQNDPCVNCPNRPKNGEVKVCGCTLPYISNPVT